jgi:hypothetical protein
MAMDPEQRPRRFVVDVDAPYDLANLGLPWRAAARGEQASRGYLYDGEQPGYRVDGHRFVSELPVDDRRAVLEYLKTL